MGTELLGVVAVVTKSYERIHRSNLVGMGVLPLQFQPRTTRLTLGLDGTETYDGSGERTPGALTDDRAALDFRRILVSSSGLVGRRIVDLDLERRHGATITRLRRGDVDLVAADSVVLEPGDRVRVVGPAAALESVAKELGDSERRVGEWTKRDTLPFNGYTDQVASLYAGMNLRKDF